MTRAPPYRLMGATGFRDPQDPYQGSQLTNVPIGQWRLRVGDYRIRYDIAEDRVLLYRVRHRKDIYRD